MPLNRCTLVKTGNLYPNGNTNFMYLQGYGFLRPSVDICFSSHALQRDCNEEAALITKWGLTGAACLSRTLQELAALDHLADVAALPHIRVTGDPSGVMVIGNSDGCQVTLEPADEGVASGSALDQIREVVVVAVAVARIQAGGWSSV